MTLTHWSRRRFVTAIAVSAASTVVLAGCGGSSASGGAGASGSTLNVVGFSVLQSAYAALEKGFQDTAAGRGVRFKNSYGASGAQSRAVIAGQKADFVTLSLSPDVKAIAEAGKIAPAWNTGATKGIVSSSVVVISFRKGNPKHITGWADIIKPGVGIVTADPGTSGSAKWNLLAAYAQAIGPTKDAAAGKAYLQAFIKNVVSWNESGRVATDTFSKGTGDVLISYENEAIAARAAGVPLDYLVPSSTVLIENPGAVTTSAPTAATAFLTYVESADGQKILSESGFRPVGGAAAASSVQGANDAANPFPAPATLTTVGDLGGWTAVNKLLFDKTAGLVTELRK